MATMADDAVAYQLLGWSSAEVNAAQQSNASAPPNESRGEDEAAWASLHAAVRTTANGTTNFRRAMQLLSGQEGQIMFHPETASDSVGCRKEPLLIVKGYFRLIKICLDPVVVAADDSSLPASSSSLSEDWVRHASDLLKRMGESLKMAIQYQLSFMNKTSQKNSLSTTTSGGAPFFVADDGSNSTKRVQCASTVVLHYLQSTLQNIHPHIKTSSVRLLGPSYRVLCDVADAFLSLLEAQKCRMDDFVATFLPSVGWEALAGLQKDVDQLSKVWSQCNLLLEQAAFCLLEFLDEGLGRVQMALRSSESAFNVPPDKQSKIIVFLLARVTSLVLMTMRFQKSFKTSAPEATNTDHGCDGGRKQLITGFLQRLVRACSLSLVARAKSEEDSVNRSRDALLDVVVGLYPKAAQYLAKIMGDLDSTNNASAISLGLECFIDLPSCDDSGTMQDASLAKLLLMKYVMEKLVATDSPFLPAPIAMVNFYQSLLFVDVPQCHHFFQTTSASTGGYGLHNQARGILSDLVCVLEHASHALCHSRESNSGGSEGHWQKVLIQQHHLLIRWLAPAATQGNPTMSTSTNHPMTNEIVLHVLQRRILSSCAVDDHYSQQDATHLISLLSQLLFHQQTETSHRRNVATLLIRLLSTSGTENVKKQNDARSLTIQSLWSNMKNANIINSTPRKRKRSRGASARSSLLPDDVYTICWVLEALAKSSILSLTGIDSRVSVEMKQMWDGILDNNDGKKKHLKYSRDVDRVMFLLSLSVGAVRSSSTLTDFFLTFTGGTSRNSSPKAFMESLLAFVELQVGSKSSGSASGNSIRHVLMHSVCIHLIHELSECIGHDLSEIQATRIGNVLKNAIISSASANASVNAIGLQYDAVSTASKMGKVLRPGFDEKSLQPLVDSINHTLAKSSWYYVAPSISNLEYFVKALPAHFRVTVRQTMPELAVTLLTSRLKGKLFCIASKEIIDPLKDVSCSVEQESRFLLTCCNTYVTKDSWSFLGDKRILMKSGSKVFVHRDKEGNVVAMVVAPFDGKLKSSSEILSAIGTLKCDTHSVSSNCELRL